MKNNLPTQPVPLAKEVPEPPGRREMLRIHSEQVEGATHRPHTQKALEIRQFSLVLTI